MISGKRLVESLLERLPVSPLSKSPSEYAAATEDDELPQAAPANDEPTEMAAAPAPGAAAVTASSASTSSFKPLGIFKKFANKLQ